MPVQNSDQILSEYHDFLTGRLTSYLFELMGYIENGFDYLKNSPELSIQDYDLDAYEISIAELRSRKHDIGMYFKAYHHNLCENISDNNVPDIDAAPQTQDLKLNTTDTIDNPILNRTIIKTRLECKQALINMSDMVSEILGREQVEKFNTYLDPESILVSIWESFGKLENKERIHLALSHIFESYSTLKLCKIYNDLSYSIGISLSASKEKKCNRNIQSSTGEGELMDSYVHKLIEEHIEKLKSVQHVRKIRALAIKGDAVAQYELANAYYEGKNIAQDFEQASLWYRRAAEQGNVDAKYSLGNMFLVGKGISQNDELVKYWYEDADLTADDEDITESREVNGGNISDVPCRRIGAIFEIPEFIYQYLMEVWSKVLIDIYEKEGSSSNEWKEAFEIIDDMITWVGLVDDKDAIYFQQCIYSGMSFRLKRGMNRIELAKEIQVDFMLQLLEFKINSEKKIDSAQVVN